MKRISFFLSVFFALMPIAWGHAQDAVTAIDSLDIDLWPDYDRASVLVLLTGTLPSGAQLPATLTVPLPETAQVNAVARIDSRDGKMYEALWVPGPGALMLTIPDLRFRLEYYLPYKVNGDRRSFDYTWLADLAVEKLRLRVQKPTAAGSFQTEPAAGHVDRGKDGFDYHIFPERAVPAGRPFKVRVDYTTISGQLSAEGSPAPSAGVQIPAKRSPSTGGSGMNWPILAIFVGVLIIVIAFVWQIAVHRAESRSRDSLPKTAKKKSRRKFCDDCGHPVNEEDKFCSRCGTDL
jgi:hypothetical protein